MPLMLEEDYQISLPSMHRVRQKFDRPRVEDPEGRIRSEFAKEEISGKYEKGSVWRCLGKPRNQESGFHCT